MTEIHGYHAHVYFDEATEATATRVVEAAGDALPVRVGRMHRRLVGPHPRWSCQLAFAADDFATVIPWLALNREGLVVFIHPETGDDVTDHTDYAMWMGDFIEIDIDGLSRPVDPVQADS